MADLDARLYLCADDRPGGRPLADLLPRAIAGGVDIFQLRMKEASDDDVLRVAEPARAICAEAGIPFFLNDRPDLALACGADGVHVGQQDMTLEAARDAAPGLLVGRSSHSIEQAQGATGADYFASGPVHETPTKPGRPAAGIALIEQVAALNTGTPWFAIGGIDLRTLPRVLAAGARRVVVVRAITEAPDPERAARELRSALDCAT